VSNDWSFGSGDVIEVRLGRRGLLADEAAAFPRGLDAGVLELDELGGVRVRGCRPKPGGGRYSLFTADTYGGDLHVSINLECLIQPAQCANFWPSHDWPGSEVEVGEFGALAHDGEREWCSLRSRGDHEAFTLWLLRGPVTDKRQGLYSNGHRTAQRSKNSVRRLIICRVKPVPNLPSWYPTGLVAVPGSRASRDAL
jgi:hypothetical protein